MQDPYSTESVAWQGYYASIQPHGATLAHAFSAGYEAGRRSVLGELEPELPSAARCCACDAVRLTADGWETRSADDGSAACLLCPECAQIVPPEPGSTAAPPESAVSPTPGHGAGDGGVNPAQAGLFDGSPES